MSCSCHPDWWHAPHRGAAPGIRPGTRCERVLRTGAQCPDAATEAVEEDADIYRFYCGLHAETVRYEQDQKAGTGT